MKKSTRRVFDEPIVETKKSSTLSYYAKYSELSNGGKKKSKKKSRKRTPATVVTRPTTSGMRIRKTFAGMSDSY
jgi:hypothetical protein